MVTNRANYRKQSKMKTVTHQPMVLTESWTQLADYSENSKVTLKNKRRICSLCPCLSKIMKVFAKTATYKDITRQ